ncbi:MAG: DNA replication/repair protein RecF [Bacilli bacterium]|nr:DNA replication/repair protein RecF [Bacilli bacterium]
MKLKELKLLNFRNYKEQYLEFNPGVNIFIGDNGSGKTNILEAIYILSLTKSSRYGTDLDLIRYDEASLSIDCLVNYDDYEKKYKITIDKFTKRVFINGNPVKKISDYVGKFSVTSFLPNDIEIIKGSPSIRRNLLNIQIGVLYNNYLNYVNEYNKILHIRNEYLKRLNINGLSDTKYLDVINDKMIDISVKIYYYRFFYIKEINQILPSIYKKLSGISDIKIEYQNNLGITDYDENTIREILHKKYKKNLYKEMMQGMTLFGLHRDDLVFLANKMDAKIYSSQGQQRLIVIAYKIAELLVFKKIKKEYPVLILDDVFSEIDIKRRNNIVKFFKDDIQVVITTTDLEEIQPDLVKNAKVFKIKNGEIKIKGGAKWKKKK